jgi:hypothetical protein
MSNPKPEPREVDVRLKSIIDYVQDCERRVLRGEIMDLQGLDRNVIEICDIITHLPAAEAQVLETKMAQLIERLEILAQSMREQQDKVRAKA